MTEPLVELPAALRSELKEPLGSLFTDAATLLEASSTPLISVGDVVTYHLIETGRTPAVALVDERTERTTVDDEISGTIASFEGFDRTVTVTNPAATLTEALLSALRTAITDADELSTLIHVDGEEDLATLPAAVIAPDGASIVYGQPGEGMVHVVVDDSVRTHSKELLARMDGDEQRLWKTLGIK